MWDILYSKRILQSFQQIMPLKFIFPNFIIFEILMYLHTNSLGQYFDKLSLNGDSCQTADSTIFVRTSIEPKFKKI